MFICIQVKCVQFEVQFHLTFIVCLYFLEDEDVEYTFLVNCSIYWNTMFNS